MTARRLKKKIQKKLNVPNFIIGGIAIMTSFMIVNVGGTFSSSQGSDFSRADRLVSSAIRIADAFEIYNQKRFSQ